MADTHSKAHDYHLVDPSPWPVIGAIGAFCMAVGLVLWMYESPPWLFIIGAAIVAYTMFVWWRDVVREGEFEGFHTPVVQLGLRYGMVLFIVSEVMFFAAWFWAYFNASLYPTEQMGGTWPPEGIEVFNPWALPAVNTVILLSSGATVTFAHHALKHEDRKGLVMWLVATVVLGAAFTAIQAYEYSVAPFSFTGGIYGSTFFMATGFHGAHVIIGTIFLLVCLFRAMAGHFKPEHHFGFEAAAWYWHFVDVVWLFLFTCIYFWGSLGATIH